MSNLSKLYQKETGNSPWLEEVGGDHFHYTHDYVKWLESKVEDHEKELQLIWMQGRREGLKEDFVFDTYTPGTSVKVTYIPFGLSAECDKSISQYVNREGALDMLFEKIYDRIKSLS